MAQFRTIPLFTMVIGTIIDELGTAVSISWPWAAIMLGTMGIILVASPDLAPMVTATGPAEAPQSVFPLLVLVGYCALWLVANASIAVNWHRFLLRNDIPEGWEYLRVDWKVWRYVGNNVLISIIGALAFIACVAVMSIAGVAAWYGAVAGNTLGQSLLFLLALLALIPAFAFIGILMFRLSLKLPAIAVGDNYGLGDAWRDSRGNNMRLFRFTILLTLTAFVLGLGYMLVQLALVFFIGVDSPITTVVTLVVWGAVTWANSILMLTSLALLYSILGSGAEIK